MQHRDKRDKYFYAGRWASGEKVNEQACSIVYDKKLVTEKWENLLNSYKVGDIKHKCDKGKKHHGRLQR